MPPSLSAALLSPVVSIIVATAACAAPPEDAPKAHTKCLGTFEASEKAPAPADPYPLMAAGWGPELGSGHMASRWAEDWSGMASVGKAPALKATELSDSVTLTLSSEMRLRQAAFENAHLSRTNDYAQTQLRAVAGADLRVGPHLRLFGELGHGSVYGRRQAATPNFQNDVALQQLFAEVRGHWGETLAGAIVGRQEFSDGPRQLISLSDGPNLHRTWNGVRLYAHGARYRVGAFDFRATRLGKGSFDEDVNHAEKLRGLNASFIVSAGNGPNTYLDPFWIHSQNPNYRLAGQAGLDDRHTSGARLWGRQGPARFDWTVARQTGRTVGGRSVDAWGLFAVQSLTLSDAGWKPRFTSRVDIASGGGSFGSGSVRAFNPLYASSNYLGESQFLGLSNLVMVAPGIAVSPTPRTSLSAEHGRAWRQTSDDAVYAGGGRFYAGTQAMPDRAIGSLSRAAGTWAASPNFGFRLNVEHLRAGSVLRAAEFPSGTYVYVDATFRY